MRLRLRWWRELFFLGALLFSLIALLPLRAALDWLGFEEKGLTAREAQGSIWLGALADARFGTMALGDVATRLRALPLLAGRARLDIAQEGDGLRGAVTVSRHGVGIDDASGIVAAPELQGLPAPALELADLSVRFGDGLCAAAEGLVKAAPDGSVAPELADSVERTGPLEWKATLRDNAVFWSGAPVDAKAVVASFARSLARSLARSQHSGQRVAAGGAAHRRGRQHRGVQHHRTRAVPRLCACPLLHGHSQRHRI